MATITKLQVDVANQKLIISATSSGVTTDSSSNTFHHRFTKVYIDTTCTFNCKNEYSTSSVAIEIPDDAITTNATLHDDEHFDGDLVDFEIPFSDIYNSTDIANDILFIWIEETEYDFTYSAVDINYFFGVTLSVSTFYETLLNHIKLNAKECCKATCSDVNFMLAWHGFNLAKTLQEYKQMVYYWNIMHNNKSSVSSGCECS